MNVIYVQLWNSFLFLLDALTVKNVDVLCATLRVIQRLAECTETSGQQLVGYYKQILPMFTRYLRRNGI